MRKRCHSNRSLVFLGFDCVPSFLSGEALCRRARVQSEVERSEPEGNLDGFVARLHHSLKNEGRQIKVHPNDLQSRAARIWAGLTVQTP
jgi:hypothetical protein